ncbi:MAG: helix-turn-helix transcriptional regulator [Candidatus Synoicihabitans palmerolidicus]|nr:helix-turn-helix transcriptional regulator [Candidatus Synoicihabitans palmerolidicus]
MAALEFPAADQLELTGVMYALSDPTKLAIVRQLASSRGRPLSICTALLGDRPKSSMSHHFKILRKAGVIETTTMGKEHLNRLRTTDLDAKFPGLLKVVRRAIRAES